MATGTTLQDDLLPEQILQAALQLYLKYGLKKVSMDDVAKAIGKSRSSLYYYYKNRDEIFEAVLNALVRDVISEIKTEMDKVKSFRDKLRAFCLFKVKTSEDRQHIFKAMEMGMDASEISSHNSIILKVHYKLMEAEAKLLRKTFKVAADQKEIKKLKTKETDMQVFLLQSGIRGIKREMGHINDFSKLGEAVDVLTAMVTIYNKG